MEIHVSNNTGLGRPSARDETRWVGIQTHSWQSGRLR